jgi:hypothetical protein
MKRHFKTKKENQLITASVFYDKGDKSFYLSIFPTTVEGDFFKSLCWSGLKTKLEDVKRYSEKREEFLIDKVVTSIIDSDSQKDLYRSMAEEVAASRETELSNPVQFHQI